MKNKIYKRTDMSPDGNEVVEIKGTKKVTKKQKDDLLERIHKLLENKRYFVFMVGCDDIKKIDGGYDTEELQMMFANKGVPSVIFYSL